MIVKKKRKGNTQFTKRPHAEAAGKLQRRGSRGGAKDAKKKKRRKWGQKA